jgi:hypothetical protein
LYCCPLASSAAAPSVVSVICMFALLLLCAILRSTEGTAKYNERMGYIIERGIAKHVEESIAFLLNQEGMSSSVNVMEVSTAVYHS